MKSRNFISKKDIILITAIIIFALFFYFIYSNMFTSSGNVEIMYNGKTVETHQLTENTVFSVNYAPNVKIEIKDGKVKVISSDCPDKVCVNTGTISKAGQTIVCLPNKLTVRIIPDGSGPDTAI